MLYALAADEVRLVPVPSSVDGVTTALVAFLLLSMAFPSMIKDRRQFFASFGLAVAILVITTLRYMMYNSAAIQVFGGFVVGLLQIGLLVTLFLSAGGMSIGELAGEVGKTIELVRRGEQEKEVIIIGGKGPPGPEPAAKAKDMTPQTPPAGDSGG